MGIEAALTEGSDFFGSELDGFIGGVVEQLDDETVGGVIEGGNRLQEAGYDMPFVVDGELNQNGRPFGDRRGWCLVTAVAEVDK